MIFCLGQVNSKTLNILTINISKFKPYLYLKKTFKRIIKITIININLWKLSGYSINLKILSIIIQLLHFLHMPLQNYCFIFIVSLNQGSLNYD